MLEKVTFTVGCLIVPVVWGIVVNYAFNMWRNRANSETDDEPVFPDYQI